MTNNTLDKDKDASEKRSIAFEVVKSICASAIGFTGGLTIVNLWKTKKLTKDFFSENLSSLIGVTVASGLVGGINAVKHNNEVDKKKSFTNRIEQEKSAKVAAFTTRV